MSEIAFVICHQLPDILFLVYKPAASTALIDYRDSFNNLIFHSLSAIRYL